MSKITDDLRDIAFSHQHGTVITEPGRLVEAAHMAHRPGWTRIVFYRRGEYPNPGKPAIMARLIYALVGKR